MSKNVTVSSTSSRRIILGGAKGQPMTILGGQADRGIVGAPQPEASLSPERVQRFREGPMAETAEKLGLRFA